MSDEAVCGTAMATPGLLKILNVNIFNFEKVDKPKGPKKLVGSEQSRR